MKLKRICTSLLILVLMITATPSILPQSIAKAASMKLTQTNICLGNYSEGGLRGYRLRVLNNKEKVKWKSNNTKVATVDSKGWVVPVSEGTAIVTATVGKTVLNCKVYVNWFPIFLNNSSITMFVGDTYDLDVEGVITSRSFSWKSNDESVATIKKSEDGDRYATVTAKKVGTTTVKVIIDKKITLNCKITVKKKEKIKIKQEYSLTNGCVVVKTKNLSPVDAYVYTNISYYRTEEDYYNKKAHISEGDTQLIQPGQTVFLINKPILLGTTAIEDIYERYEVSYKLSSDINTSFGLKNSDVKIKVVKKGDKVLEVGASSDVIDEVYAFDLYAIYYKDGEMIDIQSTTDNLGVPNKTVTSTISTACSNYNERAEYDDVELIVNNIRPLYKW